MQAYDFSDPDSTEANQTAHQRRMAEAMMAQATMGNQPAFSNRAALARVLMGGLAGMELGGVQARETALAEKAKASRSAEMNQLADAMETPEGSPDRAKLARLLMQSSNPNAAKAGLALLTARPKEEEAFTLKPGETRYKGKAVVASQPAEPEKEPEAIRTIRAQMKAAGIDPESPMGQQVFAAALKKATTHQPATSVSVNNAGEGPFWKEFGKGQAEAFGKEQEGAKGAAQVLQSITTARDLLKKGIYTGSAADWRLGAGKALQQAGFNMDQDAIANTEAFKSTMGKQVLAGIKALGAGSAISNADREFMEKIVGGQITLDPKGIERILAIGESVSRAQIASFNKKAKGLQGKAPAGFLPYSLEVEEPAQITVDDAMRLYGSGK
jgi:hypothetical protein